MSKATKRVRRIVKVQQEMHRLAEWRQAELVRRENELKAAQEEIVQVFNDHDKLYGVVIEPMARKLKSLAGEETRVIRDREAQDRRVVEEAVRLKRAERMAARVEEDARHAEEKQSLRDLIEQIGGSGGASFP